MAQRGVGRGHRTAGFMRGGYITPNPAPPQWFFGFSRSARVLNDVSRRFCLAGGEGGIGSATLRGFAPILTDCLFGLQPSPNLGSHPSGTSSPVPNPTLALKRSELSSWRRGRDWLAYGHRKRRPLGGPSPRGRASLRRTHGFSSLRLGDRWLQGSPIKVSLSA